MADMFKNQPYLITGAASGIGLATARRIVLRHGGTLTAESAPGQGATFSFTLPAQAANPTML